MADFFGISKIRYAFPCIAILLGLVIITKSQGTCEDITIPAGIDTVLVLDASGSMRLTDPNKLRNDGAKAFINSLGVNDRIALVEFSESAKVLKGLTPTSESQGTRDDLSKVGDSGEYTDLLAGLTKARELLRSEGRANSRKVVVLFSDGKMDPHPNSGTSDSKIAKLFTEELPSFKSDGIVIHTLALSDQSDKRLLSDIATFTGGISKFSPTAEAVGQAYHDISETLGTQQIQTVSDPTTTTSQIQGAVSRNFPIAEGIEEATFYVNRGASSGIVLTAPSGASFDNLKSAENAKWHQGADFDVVTISRPEAGDWVVSGIETKENFATVLTNLKLVVDWHVDEANVGEPLSLEAKFFESRKPVTLPQLSSIVTYSYNIVPTDKISEPVQKGILHDDGQNGDSKTNDGIFSADVILDEPGAYRLILTARGPTFIREQQSSFKVNPRLLEISLLESTKETESPDKKAAHAKHDEHAAVHGEHSVASNPNEELLFLIKLSDQAIAAKEKALKLKVTSSANITYNVPIPTAKIERSEYRVPVDVLPMPGKFEIQAIFGGTLKGRTISGKSNVLNYTYEGKHEVLDVEVIKTKKKNKIVEVPENTSPIVWIGLLTFIIAIVGYRAFTKLKTSLSAVVVTQETYVPPDAAIKAISEIKNKASLSEVSLEDGAYSPKKLDEILSASAITEADFQSLEELAISEIPTKIESPVSEAPSIQIDNPDLNASPEAALKIDVDTPKTSSEEVSNITQTESIAVEGTPAQVLTPAQVSESVDSEVDEETKKLLEQLSQNIGTDKE